MLPSFRKERQVKQKRVKALQNKGQQKIPQMDFQIA